MIVMDSCAACEIVRKTEYGTALEQLMLRNEAVATCDLYGAEIASIFRKAAIREKLKPALAEKYQRAALDLIDEFHPLRPLQTEVLMESIRLHHSTYDMFYFVLARRLGATLFTVDRKLMALCGENGVDCIGEVEF